MLPLAKCPEFLYFKISSIFIFESAFFEWDNTPRYGKKAKIFIRPSDVFLKGVCCELLEKAHKNNSPYLFFNAWHIYKDRKFF